MNKLQNLVLLVFNEDQKNILTELIKSKKKLKYYDTLALLEDKIKNKKEITDKKEMAEVRSEIN